MFDSILAFVNDTSLTRKNQFSEELNLWLARDKYTR